VHNVTHVTVWPEGRVDALYMRRRAVQATRAQKADFHVCADPGPFLAE
jgi:hypothetical protein